jgi:hypothetical protein
MGTSLEMRQKAIPWKRINVKMVNPKQKWNNKGIIILSAILRSIKQKRNALNCPPM